MRLLKRGDRIKLKAHLLSGWKGYGIVTEDQTPWNECVFFRKEEDEREWPPCAVLREQVSLCRKPCKAQNIQGSNGAG